MVIPVLKQQREKINTPNISYGDAISSSDDIKKSEEPIRNFSKQVSGLYNSYIQIKKEEEDAEESQKADDIYTKFSEDLQNEYSALSQTQEDLTKGYYDKTYSENVKKLDSKLLTDIDSIKNRKIRENLRSKVNNLKLNNKARVNTYVYQENVKSQTNSANRFIQTKEREIVDNINAEQGALNNEYVLTDGYKDIYNKIKKMATVNGIIDKNYLTIKAQESMDRIVKSSYNKLIGESESDEFFGGYAPVKDFLKASRQYISEDTYQDLMNKAELGELHTEVLRNTDKFVKDGEIDRSLIRKNGKNLSPLEEEQIYQSLLKELSSSSGNFSAQDKKVLDDEKLRLDDLAKDKMMQAGFLSENFYKGLQLREGLSSDELKDVIARDYKDIDIIKAVEAYKVLSELQNQAIQLPSGKITYPDSKELNNALNQIEQFIDVYAYGYDDTIPSTVNPEGLIENIFGKNLTPNEIAFHQIMSKYKVETDDGKFIVSPRKALEAIVTFNKVSDGLGIDLNKPIKGSDYENDYEVLARLSLNLSYALKSSGFAQTLPSVADNNFSSSYNATIGDSGVGVSSISDFMPKDPLSYEKQTIQVGGSGTYFSPTYENISPIKQRQHKRYKERIKQWEEARKKAEQNIIEEAEKRNKNTEK